MTTMTTPDVNSAFAAERQGQLTRGSIADPEIQQKIADGKLVAQGSGRYRVNDPGSWDNGETLYLREGQLVPQTGLDMTSGQAALYTAVPAWHSLGNVVPGGISDIDRGARARRDQLRGRPDPGALPGPPDRSKNR